MKVSLKTPRVDPKGFIASEAVTKTRQDGVTTLRNPCKKLGIEKGFKADSFVPLETEESEQEASFDFDEVLPSPNQNPPRKLEPVEV